MKLRVFFRKCLIWAAVLAALALYILWGNRALTLTQISVALPDLPAVFSGYRICQVSDLHNTSFGEENSALLEMIANCDPDIIVLTGDLIDAHRTNVDVAVQFAADATEIAPVYYVTGNHEASALKAYKPLKAALAEAGVTVMENKLVTLERGGASISLMGIHDKGFTDLSASLTALAPQAAPCTVLLAHRPEYIGTYAGAGVDLVFSGHAHGGQFRLPFFGGILAPGQGFFPEYDAGLYQVQDTQLIVSRGLGNSRFPFRLNNRPEVILAQLFPSP